MDKLQYIIRLTKTICLYIISRKDERHCVCPRRIGKWVCVTQCRSSKTCPRRIGKCICVIGCLSSDAHQMLHIEWCTPSVAHWVMHIQWCTSSHAHQVWHIKWCTSNDAHQMIHIQWSTFSDAHSVTHTKCCTSNDTHFVLQKRPIILSILLTVASPYVHTSCINSSQLTNTPSFHRGPNNGRWRRCIVTWAPRILCWLWLFTQHCVDCDCLPCRVTHTQTYNAHIYSKWTSHYTQILFTAICIVTCPLRIYIQVK